MQRILVDKISDWLGERKFLNNMSIGRMCENCVRKTIQSVLEHIVLYKITNNSTKKSILTRKMQF